MPRPLRFCPAGFPVHVVQRGNNRQACFTCDDDMAAYAESLYEGAKRHGVAIHAWVFMTNHVHILMTPTTDHGISNLMQHIGRHYAQPFNFKYDRTGTLFEGRFKSSVVQDSTYLMNCIRYIELNPVRAGVVTDPGHYHWSSYRSHAFTQKARMWSPHSIYLDLASNQAARESIYRDLVSLSLSTDVIHKIRHCVNTGLVLGTEAFRDQVEAIRS